YIRGEGQTLEAAQRASYRLLNGLAISEKYDGSAARLEKKRKADEKAKRIVDKKAEKDAAVKLEEAADKSKSLKLKTYTETLEAEIDKLKKTPPQAEASARP